MDKGKVFRNLAKKKLAEYVIEKEQKEQKGEQEPFSETVAQPKGVVQTSQQRTPYKIDLEIEGKKGKYSFVINANLSLVEKKRLMRVATAISNALKLDTASALSIRFENLLKKITSEVNNYSIDYIQTLEQLIKNIYVKVGDLVRTNQNINQAKNNLNQIIELLDEKKDEMMTIEEGTPASSVSVVTRTKEGIPIITPSTKEGIKELEITVGKREKQAPAAPAAQAAPAAPVKKIIKIKKKKNIKKPVVTAESAEVAQPTVTAPKLNFAEEMSGKFVELKNKIKQEITERFNELYPQIASVTIKNNLFGICNEFAKKLNNKRSEKAINMQYETLKKNIKKIEKETGIITEEPAQVENIEEFAEETPFSQLGEEEQEGNGKPLPRKGRHNTYRGYIGYGESIPAMLKAPSVGVVGKRGFAANPSAANSPFGQPAWSQQQYDSIGKYLNFNLVPNKRGNYAVLGN